MRLALWLVTLFLLTAACSDGREAEAPDTPTPPATATVSPTEVAAPTPTLVPFEPTPEYIRGGLSVMSAAAPCDEPFSLVGSGFESERVAVHRIAGIDETPLLIEVETDDSGSFELAITPNKLGECHPGWEFIFVAGPAGSTPSTPARWPEAVYETQQLGSFVLSETTVKCETNVEATLTGSGFPPGAEVHVLYGPPGPRAHNFASLGFFTADDAGVLEAVIPLFSLVCDPERLPEGAAIYGMAEGLAARWKALYDIVP